ncbi:hypothetical protein NESM_000266900 [Novymonas esmeraldas]|uniref:Uncharacterized protein n=1 Tax=Novymonas esmeraldas TaxID=1808958 RepID=A0AAW0FCF5_9TRYP
MMHRKRRLTVQPVDASRFSGDGNGFVVSYVNGIDHLLVDPAATDQDVPLPLPSRVMVHAYAGAQLADAAVQTTEECVEEAAVNAAAVVACRVTALRPSSANPTAAYAVRAVDGPTKIVFFSGCQRLAEVRIDDGGSTATSRSVSPYMQRTCPMQCLRVEAGAAVTLDIAVFARDPHTLCACTPQLGRLQTLRFEESPIRCVGPGRAGYAEVTVLLENGVAAVCGVRCGGDASTHAAAAASAAEEDAGDAARPPTAAVRAAFQAGEELSSLHVLHALQLPGGASPSATPLQVAWAGAATLWVVYSDGSLVVVPCTAGDGGDPESNEEPAETPPPLRAPAGAGGEVALPSGVMVAARVLDMHLLLADAGASVVEQAEVHADPRAPVLHYAVITAPAGASSRELRYGTVRFLGLAKDRGLQWRQQRIAFHEHLCGVRFERGQFHVLSQGARGAGPLYVTSLPRDAPVASSAAAGRPEADAPHSTATAIMQSGEAELGHHCRSCEALLQELHHAAQHLAIEQDAEALQHQLVKAQHALYALLSRQQQSTGVTDLSPSESLPYRLLQRATQIFRELSAYSLLAHLGLMHTVSRPLRDVLRLSEAATANKAAQAQWTSLMRDTFRHEGVYQNSVVELAMWPSSTPLCVEGILGRLGLSAWDASCTVQSVLSGMGEVTADVALFLLYYSYAGLEDAVDAAGGTHTSLAEQVRQRQRRVWFLLLFGLPAELNVWAFACYAVDHGVHPAATASSADGATAPAYLMGAAVRQMGAPPFLQLLAPVVHGLAHVTALDVLLQLVPTCIAAYTGAGEEFPVSVAMRLLCVAVRTGSSGTIEALYAVMRGSPTLRHLAAQPLAYAALHAGSVSAMRGWVEVGSPAADTIEQTLRSAEGMQQRESVLASFYILQRRYEDALRVCGAATPADATQAQRWQVVRSYLRSLLSASSAAWGERPPALAADVDVRLPADEASTLPLWHPATLAAPLLQVSATDLAEQLARAASAAGENVRCGGSAGPAQRGAAAAPAAGPLLAGGAAQRYAYGAAAGENALTHPRPPLFRPSGLLTSVERGSGAGSCGASSSSSPPAAAAGGAVASSEYN